MKTQKFRVAAALVLGVGLLVLVVVPRSVASAPSISHASLLNQVGNPCGGGFQINVIPSELCGTRSFTVSEEPQQAPGDLYVARTGTDSGDCTDSDFPCRTVQYAVDQASEGSTINVASGIYTDLNVRPRDDLTTTGLVTQVVHISKTVTIRGGYTTTNWSVPNPISHPTILDARGQGRVLYITGASAPNASISTTVEGLHIIGGDSDGMGGEAGGGVYVITATVAISGCQVVSNTASGIYLHSSDSATLSGNAILSNAAYHGGGVYLYSSANAALSGNTIQGNVAGGWYGASGGGVYLGNSPNVALIGNIILSNTGEFGGGVYLWDSANAMLSDNTILSNTAWGRLCGGGGVFLLESANATLRDNFIQGNSSGGGGGVFLWGNDNTILIGNIIQDNEGEEGGGIYLWDSHGATLDNNVVADNQSWWGAGSGVCVAESTAYLRHTTLARNTGDSGLYVTGAHSTVAMTNTILVSHTVGISVTAGSTATLEATLWGAGTWANIVDWMGDGVVFTDTINVRGDPAFMHPDGGDYHISSASAALDAGVDAGVIEDIDGDRRSAGYPDIGADELQVALRVTKRAYPSTVQPGERLTYTIRVTNTASLDLHATITDTLPFSVTLGGTLSGTALLPGRTVVLPDGMVGITWTAFITAPGGVWTGTVVVTVEMDYVGPLTNVVKVTTEEGATGIYTEISTAIILHPVYLPVVLRNASGATIIHRDPT